MTPAEAFLWKHIKARKIDGYRFTRQHSIAGYIVDFYCAQAHLIIELDGEVYNNHASEEYDLRRTQTLNSAGYHLLRFENKMVFQNFESVIQEIKEHLE